MDRQVSANAARGYPPGSGAPHPTLVPQLRSWGVRANAVTMPLTAKAAKKGIA